MSKYDHINKKSMYLYIFYDVLQLMFDVFDVLTAHNTFIYHNLLNKS